MSSRRSSDLDGPPPEYRIAPVDGWSPAVLVAVATGSEDLRARLVMDLIAGALGGLALYWGLSARHIGTGSEVFVIILGVLLILPLVSLGRRYVTGFRGEVRYYRFGSGWLARGRGEAVATGRSEQLVRTDQLARLAISANLFGRYFVDLTDTEKRHVRLVADDLRRPEYWRAVADGVDASVGSGTLDPSGARMDRCQTWLAGRAGAAKMPADYHKPIRS